MSLIGRRPSKYLPGVAWIIATALAGCAEPIAVPQATTPLQPRDSPVGSENLPLALPGPSLQRMAVPPRIQYGTGRFVGEPADMVASAGLTGQPVTLDFNNADAREVVRSVLGDILKVPYIVDPAVQGNITLQSGGSIPRSSVIPELASALRLAGLAVVQNGGLYKIVPLAQAAREVDLSGGVGGGFVGKIVTPRYVSASELEKLLDPLVPPGTTVRAEPSRNVLIVNGPAQDVAAVLANLAIFDVDTLRGLSTALLPLQTADATQVAKEVDGFLAGLGDAREMVHVIPLERLNAILVTSMRPNYLDRVRQLVANLDKGGSSSERALFVYDVQNGRAGDLAAVLSKALGLGGDTSNAPDQHGQESPQSGAPGLSTGATTSNANPLLGGVSGSDTGAGGLASSSAAGRDTGIHGGEDSKSAISVTADAANNALLIRATSVEYASISAALRRLDRPKLQVMVEAVLAEVTLTNQLAYGLQYYVKSGNLQALFASPASGATSASFPGFNFSSGLNFAYGAAAGSTVILQLLQQLTQVRVLSSPNLFVANNQVARIEVGDQVPIATGSATSTISSNAPIVNSIEYRDTGVILKVTPRVNASGIVSLDVGEEVSSVATTTSSTLNSPTISERKLDTTVSIGDGQTVALGGLISDNRTTSKNGIPILQNIPGLGWLFSQRNNQLNRTELIAILTPHVVRNGADMRAITDELQRKLPLTFPVAHGNP